MTYDWNDSGKPPRYNVLLNELPNGNNPFLNYENKIISKDKKKLYLKKYFHRLILLVFHYVEYALVNERKYLTQLVRVIE